MKVLAPGFFARRSETVARDLLGKYLVRKIGRRVLRCRINEVEMYDGFDDKASHAHKGVTLRNEIMFAEGGYFYVYLIYGMYYMLNVTCGKKGYPSAILIRGAGELNGPGKLSKFLKIDKSFNGKLALPESKLWFEDRGEKVDKKLIVRTPRIGVDYAGDCANKLYRFILSEDLPEEP